MCCAALVLLGLNASAVNAADDAAAPLSLGFMPYLNAELLIEKYTPLAQYLTEKLGRPVQITVARNYAEHIRKTGTDEIDIAFLGGSPYVVIGDTYGPKPLLARYEFDGVPTFRAVIFVARDSPFTALSELSGKRVAFGNTHSTLSTQVPLYMLMQAGVQLDELAGYTHLRNHSNVILGVEYGDFDAGAVAEEVFREHLEQGRKIRALAYSPQLSTHVFVSRATMEETLRKRIAAALVDLKDDPRGPAVLQAVAHNLTGFAPAADHDYDLHREILRQVLPILEP